MKSKIIKICGKEVEMIYCCATENGFERLTQTTINIFIPKLGKDNDGNDIIIEPATATIGDFLMLAVAGIIAAYARKDQEPPLTANDIMYEVSPTERNEMINAIIELRQEWYAVPASVEETLKKEATPESKETPNA